MNGTELFDLVPKWVVVLCFVFIIILSVLGNLSVIVAFIAKKSLKTVTNIFIVCLSVADLFIGVVVTSLTMVQVVLPEMTTGLACKLPPYIELSCLTASIYSLFFVSLDRYLGVVHPTVKKLTRRKAVYIVIGIWVWACLYGARLFIQQSFAKDDSLPVSDFSHDTYNDTATWHDLNTDDTTDMATATPTEPLWTGSPPPPSLSATPATDGVLSVDNDPDRNGEKDQEENEDTFCNLLVENDEDDLNFRIADLVVLFVVPFVAMLYMYVRVGVKLGFSKLPVTTSIRSKRRIVRFLFTNILVFFASWLPFYLTDVIHDSLEVAWGKDHGDKIEDNAVYILLRFIFILAALSNSFINPLIYGLFNENFKVIIQDVLKSAFKGCCCGGNQVHLEPPPANPTSADVSSPGVNLINQHPAPGRRHNLIPRAPYVAFTKHDAVSHGAVLMVAPKESFRESI